MCFSSFNQCFWIVINLYALSVLYILKYKKYFVILGMCFSVAIMVILNGLILIGNNLFDFLNVIHVDCSRVFVLNYFGG